MRKKSIIIILLILFSLVSNITFNKRFANAGIYLVDYGDKTKSENSKLDNEKWYYTDNLVNTSNKKDAIIFDHTCDEYDKYINREKVQNLKDYGVVDLFNFTTIINLFSDADLSSKKVSRNVGARFGVAFHLSYAADDLGSYDSFYLCFEYIGSDKYDIKFIKFIENEEILLEKKNNYIISSDNITIKVDAFTTGKININIKSNFTEILNEELQDETLLNGYFGFLENDMFGASISYIDMKSKGYITPENININEHFNNNCYNAKALYSNTNLSYVYGNSLKVIDDKLVFLNAGDAYISTKHIYSNFEFTFKILDMKKESSVVDSKYVSENADFAIAIGCNEYRSQTYDAPYRILFSHDKLNAYVSILLNDEEVEKVTLDTKYNPWINNNLEVRILYIDGQIRVGLRINNEVGYKPIINYLISNEDLKNVPTGYIRLYTLGRPSYANEYSTLANMTLDDFSITNFDDNGQIVEVDHVSNVWPNEDYEYIDSWDDNDIIKGDE